MIRYLLPFLLVLGLALPAPATPQASAELVQLAAASNQLEALCTAAYDGDTITIKLDSGKVEKVRLLGVDTAEMGQGHWGVKARDFTRGLVVNKRVTVKFDVQQRDRYGRLLGYAYTADGKFVNLEIIRQGYAMLLTYAPNVAHVDEFTRAQTAARTAGQNIWSANGLKQSPKAYRAGGKKPAVTRGEGMQIQSVQRKPAAAKAAAGAGQVSMNMKSRKYHAPGCRYYGCGNCQTMSLADVQASGGVPCKVCH